MYGENEREKGEREQEKERERERERNFSAAAQTTAILCHRPAFLMQYRHAYVNTQKISGVKLYGSVCDVRASAARDVSAFFALYVCANQVNVDLLRVAIAWWLHTVCSWQTPKLLPSQT